MPYEFKLLDDPHVSLVTFTGKVTQEEIEAESIQALEALNRCTETFFAIADLTQKPVFAANVLKIQKAMEVVNHKQFGWAIIIGVNALASFWVELLGRSVGMKFKAFQNPEDAFAFVDGMRKVRSQPARGN